MLFCWVRQNLNAKLSNTHFLQLPTDGVGLANGAREQYISVCQIYCTGLAEENEILGML